MHFLLLGVLLLIGLTIPAPAVSAHRDGCHRWHSCPSDSGSYTCGDLGYYSECPVAQPAPKPVHVPVTTTQVVYSSEQIAFNTVTKNTWEEYGGYTRQIVAGVNGLKKISTRITYIDGVQTKSEVIATEVAAQPQDAVQLVGKRIKPLATINKISKQKNGKYSIFGTYGANQKVIVSVDGKKLKKVTANTKGEFVVKDVKLKSSSVLKVYRITGKKDQQISEKTFVDLKKNRVMTEYVKLHHEK